MAEFIQFIVAEVLLAKPNRTGVLLVDPTIIRASPRRTCALYKRRRVSVEQ